MVLLLRDAGIVWWAVTCPDPMLRNSLGMGWDGMPWPFTRASQGSEEQLLHTPGAVSCLASRD